VILSDIAFADIRRVLWPANKPKKCICDRSRLRKDRASWGAAWSLSRSPDPYSWI